MPDNVLLSADPAHDLKIFLSQKKYSKISVLVDENTHKHCYPIIKKVIPTHNIIEVKSGEEQKNLQTCTAIWQALTDHAFDRHSAVIVLGGGVLGDMGGFCAATYKRGIEFMLIPTTLLSQADASIGGKLGIDFNHFKNHIGVFQLPAFTLLYTGFLKTLPNEELRSGFAEIIKHVLISDPEMWDIIRAKSLNDQDWNTLLKHSVDFKSYVVKEDPKEKGLRKILNAGHTIGHALESYLLTHNRKVLHGEAIAAGLIAEAWIAVTKDLLRQESFEEIMAFIIKIFGRIDFRDDEIMGIAQLAIQDKKNKENKILCVLLEGIGRARWDCEISLDEVKRALSFYRTFQM